MADATPRTYVYGIIAFVFVIMGGLTFISPFASLEPSMVTGDRYTAFNESFNRMDDVTAQLEGIQSSITEATADPGLWGVLNALIASSWQSLRLMFTSFGFMNDAMGGLTTVFGVPAWIPALLVLIVITLIAFTIWSAIFQSEL